MRLPASEEVDVVDIEDRLVGKAHLSSCLEQGLLHRAVAVVVVRKGGNLLLQRRRLKDRWHPGRWTLSCTGHVRAGETYQQAAKRELKEEVGLKSPVALLGKVLLPRIRSSGLTEWEHVALFVSSTDESPKLDPVELEEARDVRVSEAREMLVGRKLTPDAKILLRRYLDSTQGRPWSRPSLRARSLPTREML